jgi:hypothetical protein
LTVWRVEINEVKEYDVFGWWSVLNKVHKASFNLPRRDGLLQIIRHYSTKQTVIALQEVSSRAISIHWSPESKKVGNRGCTNLLKGVIATIVADRGCAFDF